MKGELWKFFVYNYFFIAIADDQTDHLNINVKNAIATAYCRGLFGNLIWRKTC